MADAVASLGSAVRRRRAAAHGLEPGDLDFLGHRDPVLRRAVRRLRDHPRALSGGICRRQPLDQPAAGRHQHRGARDQQPDDGAGRARRAARGAPCPGGLARPDRRTGCAFLAIKAVEYRIDYLEHLVPSLDFRFAGPQADQVELFFYMYFFITGVHALHVLIGIGCIATIAVMASRNAFSPAYFTPVDVTGLYWHLVDVIWLFVFPILYLISRS